jgi:hypothetical protein
MKLDLPALESWLGEAACVLRGPVDAPKLKDFVPENAGETVIFIARKTP